jgi:hypothetical protein
LFEELVLLPQFLQFGRVVLGKQFLLETMDGGEVGGRVWDAGGQRKGIVDLLWEIIRK